MRLSDLLQIQRERYVVEHGKWPGSAPALTSGTLNPIGLDTLGQHCERLVKVRREHTRCEEPGAIAHDDRHLIQAPHE